jgi:N utilization substance protein A
MKKDSIAPLLEEIAAQRGVGADVIVKAIELGISVATRKKTKFDNLTAKFDIKTGSFSMYRLKTVQEEVEDPDYEITESEAKEIDPDCIKGDEIKIEFDYPDLGRLAAMNVRRVMGKTMREVERETLVSEMELNKWKMVAATVTGIMEEDDRALSIGGIPALLPRTEQLYREEMNIGEVVQVVIIDIAKSWQEPTYITSRTHPLLLGGLFRREIPEISDGIVVIKGMARDTAGRSKISVFSKKETVDAVGACVGPSGERIQRVTKELSGEKIDVIKYSENQVEYISAALIPAKIKSVKINEKTNEARVETEPDQHKIAVGKGGLNIRLACRLTRWNITLENPASN